MVSRRIVEEMRLDLLLEGLHLRGPLVLLLHIDHLDQLVNARNHVVKALPKLPDFIVVFEIETDRKVAGFRLFHQAFELKDRVCERPAEFKGNDDHQYQEMMTQVNRMYTMVLTLDITSSMENTPTGPPAGIGGQLAADLVASALDLHRHGLHRLDPLGVDAVYNAVDGRINNIVLLVHHKDKPFFPMVTPLMELWIMSWRISSRITPSTSPVSGSCTAFASENTSSML